jgi:biopolymer transport protein TolQ
MSDSYSIALKSKSIFDIIYEADVVVQVVVLLLLFASVWSWSIILNKLLLLRTIQRKDKNFSRLFNSKSSFADIFEAIKDKIITPIEHIFIIAVNDMKHYDLGDKDHSAKHRDDLRARLHLTMMHHKNKHIADLESNLGYLATIASAAPFIGLFGTVWGIMRSFQAIAFSKNTSLAVVAPGIAEALFATALGLIAAIPALVFYNILLGKISSLETATDDFLIKFNNKLETILKL